MLLLQPEDQVGTISRSKEKSAEDMAVTDHSEADLGVAAKAHQFATSTVVAAEKRRPLVHTAHIAGRHGLAWSGCISDHRPAMSVSVTTGQL